MHRIFKVEKIRKELVERSLINNETEFEIEMDSLDPVYYPLLEAEVGIASLLCNLCEETWEVNKLPNIPEDFVFQAKVIEDETEFKTMVVDLFHYLTTEGNPLGFDSIVSFFENNYKEKDLVYSYFLTYWQMFYSIVILSHILLTLEAKFLFLSFPDLMSPENANNAYNRIIDMTSSTMIQANVIKAIMEYLENDDIPEELKEFSEKLGDSSKEISSNFVFFINNSDVNVLLMNPLTFMLPFSDELKRITPIAQDILENSIEVC